MSVGRYLFGNQNLAIDEFLALNDFTEKIFGQDNIHGNFSFEEQSTITVAIIESAMTFPIY